MPKELINPEVLAKPSGFNHAIAASGKLLFLAGQDASNGQGKIVAPGDIVAQYEQVLRNLYVVLKQAGGTMEDIVKLDIFVTNRALYKEQLKDIGEVHRA